MELDQLTCAKFQGLQGMAPLSGIGPDWTDVPRIHDQEGYDREDPHRGYPLDSFADDLTLERREGN